jgi:hypothetical protein
MTDMWLKTEYESKIDIQPAGEGDRHILGPECECLPRLSKHVDRRVMIIHKSFDGVEGFELATLKRERRVA